MHNRSLPLDLLRTLAIFLVFTSHFNSFATYFWFGKLGDFGWVGVDLFFVLSGFLISTQLYKELKRTGTISFKDFYIRRGFRIWPNFFFVLAIYFFFPAFAERSTLAPLWRYLTFTLNFGLDYTVTGAFSHAWSLCVEEQFYLLLPLFLIFLVPRLTFRRSLWILCGIFSFGVMIRNIEWHHWIDHFHFVTRLRFYYKQFYQDIYYPTYCRLDSLAMGVGIGALLQFCPKLWDRMKKYGNLFLGLGALMLFVSYEVTQEEYTLLSASFGYLLSAFSFGFLLLAALSPSGLFSKFQGKWATSSANLAFAFYLVHKAMIHHTHAWLIEMGLDPGSILYPLTIIGICWITSTILYLGIEKPFLKWRDRLLHVRSLHFG